MARTAAPWCDEEGLAVAINLGMYQEDLRSNVGYARAGGHVNHRRWVSSYKSALAFGPKRRGLPPATLVDLDVEVTKYDLATPLSPTDGFSIHVNMDAWKALPDDLKLLLEGYGSYASDLWTNLYFSDDAAAREKITKAPWNVTETRLPPEEIDKTIKFGQVVLDKYSAKDKYFAEASGLLKKYLKALGQ